MAKDKISEEVNKESFKEGKVITVIGGKGAVGTTTIAVNLAVSLAEKKEVQSVALIDMNLLFGDLPLFLDSKPEYNWSDITKTISRLDDTFLKNILSVNASGVCVLPSSDRLTDQNEVTPEIIAHLLMLMRRVFDFVILDVGQPLEDISFKTLELSDIILLVSILNHPCLLTTNKLLRAIRDLGFPLDEKIKIVINRYLKKSNPSIEDAGASFEKEIFWTIPNDYQTTSTAINEGKSLAQFAPRKAITKNFRKLATKLTSESRKDDLSLSSYQQQIMKKADRHTYVYQNESLLINRRRRKGDMAENASSARAKITDRRREMRDGIIIIKYDRRRNDNPNYSGPEKRSGVDRRSGKDRRK
ncbi:MAG: AAA family ATPase [Desulfobacterales bacterium]|jgi:pilus assembly protein CpaE